MSNSRDSYGDLIFTAMPNKQPPERGIRDVLEHMIPELREQKRWAEQQAPSVSPPAKLAFNRVIKSFKHLR